jgi:hypothetical protein
MFTGLLLSATLALGESPSPRLDVRLYPDKATLVLGEPLLLTVTVTNKEDVPIEAERTLLQEDGMEPDIQVFISQGTAPYKEYTMGIFPAACVERMTEILEPGVERQYRLRVLYTSKSPSALALPQPGTWRIKARYRLVWRDSPGSRPGEGRTTRNEYDSDAIEVTVAEPAGTDEILWRHVRKPAFLFFLQAGGILREPAEDHPTVTVEAMDLLQEFPDSSYDAAIRWALKQYYERRRERLTYLESQKDRELSRIRSALGIDELPPGPFPEDARLDVIVTYEFPEETPLLLVLEQLSWQARVPLSADPEFAEQRYRSLKTTKSLREFMDARDDWGRKWEPHGNGYRLVPAPIVLPPGFPGGPKQK